MFVCLREVTLPALAQMNRAGWEGMAGGTNAVKPGQSLASIWLLEFMLTSLLVFVVFAATDDVRPALSQVDHQHL